MVEQPVHTGSRGRDDDDFTGEHHVYEPYRVGLPPLRPYVRELWRRRQFAFQLSKTKLRAKHFDTVFGQLWLILNPILLTCVYFMLVDILRGGARGNEFFAHLMAGLFAYQLFSNAVQEAAKSVVNGGRLILNTAFPRVLLPLSAVIHSFRRFVPTLGIYAVVHVLVGAPIGWELLLAIPIVVLLLVLASGVSILVAAAQVYFRDLSSFLPYVLRIWLYATPILYYAHEVPERYEVFLWVNPIAPLIRAWSSILDEGRLPDAEVIGAGAAWAFFFFLVGTLFFMSRERELAVRL
jgi:teichoic acid transport system permease protein